MARNFSALLDAARTAPSRPKPLPHLTARIGDELRVRVPASLLEAVNAEPGDPIELDERGLEAMRTLATISRSVESMKGGTL